MLNWCSHQSHYQILLLETLVLQAPDLLAMKGHPLAHAPTRSRLKLNLTVMAVSTYAFTHRTLHNFEYRLQVLQLLLLQIPPLPITICRSQLHIV